MCISLVCFSLWYRLGCCISCSRCVVKVCGFLGGIRKLVCLC